MQVLRITSDPAHGALEVVMKVSERESNSKVGWLRAFQFSKTLATNSPANLINNYYIMSPRFLSRIKIERD